jgi:hypothetical protein
MKKSLTLMAVLCLAGHLRSRAQAKDTSTMPVKTGNEWRMPSPVIQKAKDFSNRLKTDLNLDDEVTKQIFQAYLVNTKPVDEIRMNSNLDDKGKARALQANRDAFKDKLKGMLTAEQFTKFQKMDANKLGY